MGRSHVLIHAPLYAALRRLAIEVRTRFRRHVERLSAGDRLLFTVAHAAARDATTTLPRHLQLWDLVHHDRVSGRARRVNPSAEAEFLDFDEVESELIAEPPPHPGAASADVPALEAGGEAGGEAGVLELVLPPDSLGRGRSWSAASTGTSCPSTGARRGALARADRHRR